MKLDCYDFQSYSLFRQDGSVILNFMTIGAQSVNDRPTSGIHMTYNTSILLHNAIRIDRLPSQYNYYIRLHDIKLSNI